MLLATLRKFVSPHTPAARRSVHPTTFRPSLENLESRWVPATLSVGAGKTYATITAALNAANSNDTIKVYASNQAGGAYNEQINITKDGIKLLAQGNITLKAPAGLSGSIVHVKNDADDVMIKGFSIDGTGNTAGTITAAIRVNNNSSATIRNNTIFGLSSGAGAGAGIGILVGDLYQFSANRSNAEGTGDAKILNNTISDYDGAGVVVNGTHSSGIVENNTITGVGTASDEKQYGVQISADAKAWVTGNTLTNNNFSGDNFSSYGILVYDNVDRTVISRNSSTGNDTGVVLYGSRNSVVTNNGFSNNAGDGVSLASAFPGEAQNLTTSDNTVFHNEVRGNGADGVSLYDAVGNLIKWNAIEDNAGAGIYLEGGSCNEIWFGGISGNGDSGLLLNNSVNNNIVANLITCNAGDGITLLDGSTGNTIIFNIIVGNGGAGIRELDSAVGANTIACNIVADNGDGGYADELGTDGNNNTLLANESSAEAAADTLVDDFVPEE